jgi:hypothetical protein
MPTEKFGVTWTPSTGSGLSVSPDITGDTTLGSDFSIAGAQTNQQQQIGFDVANLKGVIITVSGNATHTVVLKTNDTGSPAHTKTFPIGGGELFWNNRSPETSPFGSTDITTTYWTHGGAQTVSVRYQFLFDA